MRSIQSWFDEYSESHQNGTNTLVHWICVPVIFFSVIGLLTCVPPSHLPWIGRIPMAKIVVGLGLLFYLQRSLTLTVGMALWSSACLMIAQWLQVNASWPLWVICGILFVVAWIGQFIGHHIEGKRPSSAKDLQFLLIGPAWLMAKLYRRLGIPV